MTEDIASVIAVTQAPKAVSSPKEMRWPSFAAKPVTVTLAEADQRHAGRGADQRAVAAEVSKISRTTVKASLLSSLR